MSFKPKSTGKTASTAADAAAAAAKGVSKRDLSVSGLPSRTPKSPAGAELPSRTPKSPAQAKTLDDLSEAEVKIINKTLKESNPKEVENNIVKNTDANPKDVAEQMENPAVNELAKSNSFKERVKKITKFAVENPTVVGLAGLIVYSMIIYGESDPGKAAGRFLGDSIESGSDAAGNIFDGIFNGIKNVLGDFMWIFWVFVAVMGIGLLYGFLSLFGIF